MRARFASFGDELVACDGDVTRLLDVITRRAAELVGEGSVLAVVSDDGTMLEPVAAHHAEPDVRAAMTEAFQHGGFEVGVGLAGSAVADRTPVVVVDAAAHTADLAPGPARRFAERHPMHALMIVPMIAYGEVVGSLGVVRFVNRQPYSSEALLALEALADRAALRLADARRAPRRLHAADYEAIFEHSVDGVLFSVPDGRVLAANPAACQILRASERDLCRLGRAGIVVDDARSRALIAERRAHGRARGELTMRRGDGTLFVADVSSTVFTSDGELRACVIFHDITDEVSLRDELERKSDALARLARADELTGLRNRRGFLADVQQALAIADRDRVTVQLVYLDIDHLKRINDRVGHDAGDAAIRALAEAIHACTRAADVAARLGGDEFALLLYGATREDAEHTVDRILAATSAAGGPPASYGVIERQSGATTTLEHLLHEADQRMYERKARARDEDLG